MVVPGVVMQLFDTNFTSLDWCIVVAYLLISIFVGIWANRYVGNIAGYLVAGRTLRIRLALATMTGTEIGLVTVMYSAELGFTQQYASLYLALYELVILLFIGLTGVVVYRLRQSKVLTIPEYYERRYSRGVRVLGGVMMVLSGVLNMGLFLKAGALFLVSVTGFTEPEWLQQFMVDAFDYHEPVGLKLIMTGLLLLVLFYTVLGGMISVVITDLIQFVILGTGMVIVTLFVAGEIGIDGFSEVVTVQNGYFDPTSTDNPSTVKSDDGIGPVTLTAQFVVLVVALMLWPTGASRTLAVKTPEIARKLYLCSTIPFLARRSLPVLWGIGAFAFFHSHPELNSQFQAAIQAGGDVNTQAAMPLFLAKIIPSGLLGAGDRRHGRGLHVDARQLFTLLERRDHAGRSRAIDEKRTDQQAADPDHSSRDHRNGDHAADLGLVVRSFQRPLAVHGRHRDRLPGWSLSRCRRRALLVSIEFCWCVHRLARRPDGNSWT